MINPFAGINLGQSNPFGPQNALASSGLFGQPNLLASLGQSSPLDPSSLLGQQNPLATLGLSGLDGSGTDLMQMLQMLLAMVSGGMDPMLASGANPMFGGGEASGNPYENFLGGGGGGGGGYSGGGGGGGVSSSGGGGGGGGYSGGGSVGSSSNSGSVLDPGLTDQEASPGAYEMLKRAGSMVGLHERSNRNEIHKLTGKSGIDPATTPWCAAFAMNLIDQHKLLDLDGLSNRNYCPTIKNWAQGKKIYGTPDKYKPKPGDAILFDWQGGRNDVEHIGLVEKVKNGKVYTIEGNSSDSVKRRVYDLKDPRIDGYVVTKGTKKKPEAKPEPKKAEPTPEPPKSKTVPVKTTPTTAKKPSTVAV